MRATIALFCLGLIAALLAGCADGYRTDGEVAQTAVAQGCWAEDTRPTPYPVTITVPGGSAPTPTTALPFGVPTGTPAPTATDRPTTTPLPRCTPRPGQTQAAWPTPFPTAPPYPTRPVSAAQPQLGAVDVLRAADPILLLDVAAHPQASWAAVAAIPIPITNAAAPSVLVRVYRPAEHRWSLAATVDRDGSHPGHLFRSVVTGITPDGTVHVIWGATDYPDLALFAARSTDFGETWSAPERIGASFFTVLDVAVTATNELYVLALWRDAAGDRAVPALLHRDPAGAWDTALLPVGATWYASSGALAVVGDGAAAQLVVVMTTEASRPGGAWTLTRPLAGGPWRTQLHTTPDATGTLAEVQVVAYVTGSGATPRQGITFSATLRDSGAMVALTSLDGGATWRPWSPLTPPAAGRITAGGIAFDPAAQRLVAVWNCCAEAIWGNADSTHYAAWADPTGGDWTPAAATAMGNRAPLITGARSANLTRLAHAPNARIAWLVWVEDGQTVRARAANLDQIIPADQYPTPTIRPAPTGGQP